MKNINKSKEAKVFNSKNKVKIKVKEYKFIL